MLILLLISCVLGASLIWLAHILRIKKLVRNEVARKLVHFAHALTIVGWPIYVGYWLVVVGELVFIGAVILAQEYRIFHELRQIDRKTWGEFFFPAGVICLALLMPPIWVFVIAILLLGLADGAAAIVGKRIKSHQYHVFGQRKSVAGSLAFFSVAVAVVLIALVALPNNVSIERFLLAVIGIPLLTTVAENASPYGSDNFTIPLIVYAGFAGLQLI